MQAIDILYGHNELQAPTAQESDDDDRLLTKVCPNNIGRQAEEESTIGREDEESANISGFENQSDLDAVHEDVVDLINRLYRLLIKIRNPAIRLPSSKAWSHRSVDKETGIDLMDEFCKIEALRVQDLMISHSIREPEKMDSFLSHRLSRANVHRRQQFEHWRHNRDKLAHETAKRMVQTGTMVVREAAGGSGMNKELTPAEVVKTGQTGPSLSAPSSASRLIPVNLILDDDETTISESTNALTIAGSQDGQLEFPTAATKGV